MILCFMNYGLVFLHNHINGLSCCDTMRSINWLEYIQ